MKNKKTAVKKASKKNDKCENPNMKAGREINPLTGCRVGSKGDIIGTAVLSTKDPVEILKNVKEAVEKTWTNKKPTDSQIQRKAMSWIDWLHEMHTPEFKSAPEAIDCSRATRLASKPAKAEKAPKAKKEPKVKKEKAAKKVKAPAAKKEAKKACETSTAQPEAGAAL